jgi:autoinducer 2-degrading protein
VNKFVLIVEFDVKPESRAKFDAAIEINAKASVANEPGCFQFDVMRSPDDPNKVVLYEVYASAAAFQAHLAMEHTKTFLGMAKDLVNKQTAVKLERVVYPGVKPG